MYKRFRIIKKERERNEGEREDIGEIEKLKKVLLNKLLLLIDKYPLCSDKTFMKYESLVKNTFTEDYSGNFLIISIFFYSTSNVLGNFQLNNSFLQTDCIGIRCINNLLQTGIRKNESFEHVKNSINVPPMMYHWEVELDAYRWRARR